MEISKESWAAMIEGQTRDAQKIELMNNRLRRMAKQVEKLSMMLEEEVRSGSEFYEEEYGFAGNWTLDEDIDKRLTYLEDKYNQRTL